MKPWTIILKELSAAHGTWAAMLLLLATVIPLFLPDVAGIVLVAACVALILAHRGDQRRCDGRSLIRSPLGWMAALYALYVIGTSWSSNADYAWFDLQVKALMFVIPLVVLLLPREDRSGGDALLRAFTLGAATASAACSAVAAGHYIHHLIAFHQGTMSSPTTAYFISSNFSLFLHPSYFAMCLVFALIHLELPGAPGYEHSRIIRVLLIAGVLFCASKMGWMAMGTWWAGLLVFHWRDGGVRRRVFTGSLGAGALLAMVVTVSPFFQEKIGQFNNAIQGGAVDVSAQGSTESRELIWGAAIPLIRAYLPWGTGTGDVKDVLIQRYTELGFTHAVEQRLNAHSQLLQTPLTLGLPGAIILLALFLVPGIHAIRRQDELMIAFLVLLGMNWAVESMLETQAGVLFLSWGALMLALRTSPNENTPA